MRVITNYILCLSWHLCKNMSKLQAEIFNPSQSAGIVWETLGKLLGSFPL